jgi:hypothetical protein
VSYRFAMSYENDLVDYEGPDGSIVQRMDELMPTGSYRISGGGSADISIHFRPEFNGPDSWRAELGVLAVIADRINQKCPDNDDDSNSAILKISAAIVMMERYIEKNNL